MKEVNGGTRTSFSLLNKYVNGETVPSLVKISYKWDGVIIYAEEKPRGQVPRPNFGKCFGGINIILLWKEGQGDYPSNSYSSLSSPSIPN